MLRQVSCYIKGVAPLIMHSCRLANPLEPMAIAKSKLTSAKNKTEEMQIELQKISFISSFYTNESGKVIIPGENIEAMMVSSYIKNTKKGGKDRAKSGLISDGSFELIYNGPSTVEELWNDKKFVDNRMAIVNRARIMVTRPIFKQWELKFDLNYESEITDKKEIASCLEYAGRLIGIGTYRPKFGRFMVVDIQ